MPLDNEEAFVVKPGWRCVGDKILRLVDCGIRGQGNQLKVPASIKQLSVPVRGPSANALDVPCANGGNVALAPGQSFTCTASLPTGYGQADNYTFWADWQDFGDVWHTGELGPAETLTLAQSDQTLAIANPVSVSAPNGFATFQPLTFQYAVSNVSGAPASIQRLSVPVRGPSGNALDVPCANGTDVTLAPAEVWTCNASLPSGYGQEGPYVFWADWQAYDDQWHAGQLGPSQAFSLSGSPTAVSVISFSAKRHRRGVQLRWRTATEVGVLGFNVYRIGSSVLKVNRHLIPTAAGHQKSYRILDSTCAGHGRCSYRLEMMSSDGSRTTVASTSR